MLGRSKPAHLGLRVDASTIPAKPYLGYPAQALHEVAIGRTIPTCSRNGSRTPQAFHRESITLEAVVLTERKVAEDLFDLRRVDGLAHWPDTCRRE